MISRLALWMGVALTAGTFVNGVALAQTAPLLQEVHTLSGAATPIEHELDITQAGSYQLQLTDLHQPAAFTSLKLAVTNGTAVLGTLTLGSTTPAVLTFDAPQATLFIRVVGTPDATKGTGSVGVSVTKVGDSTPLQSFVETIGVPSPGLPDNQASIDDTFTPTVSGDYQVVLTDMTLPQSLNDLILSVVRVGDPAPLVTIAGGAGTSTAVTFTAVANVNYHVVALAESDATLKAGLFSVRMIDAGGNTTFSRTKALGRVEQLGTVTLTAGPQVLQLTDLQFPVALSQVGAVLALDGQRAAIATVSGSTAFTAVTGTHLIYAVGTAPGASTGSYGIEVGPQGGAALFSSVKTVGGAVGTTPAFSYVADIPAAGAYRVRLADFSFPSGLTATQLAVAQSGTILGSLSAPGTLDLTNVAAGHLFIVALAQASTASGGVLGIDVTPTAGGAAAFEVTQGVGNLFQSRKVSVPAAGSYRVSVQDLGFPISFKELGAVVTRGAERLGTVLSGSSSGTTPAGTHFDFDATVGNYFVTFIATPDVTANAGTYGILVDNKPPSPTVTLAANPGQVSAGGTADLTWSATNATSCVSSDGWSGARAPAGGTFKTSAMNTSTTFTLACTGDGGTTSKSVTVTIVAQDGGGGGGGSMSWSVLLALGLGVGASLRRRRVA